MLNSVRKFDGSVVHAADGSIGRIEDVFFDDHLWTIRYLVVDTGHWLSGRRVLISPYAIRQPLNGARGMELQLTRQQVADSPGVDAHEPVSRQHEQALIDYYGYPAYWAGGGLWAMVGHPYLPPSLPTEAEFAVPGASAITAPVQDAALRSADRVSGYAICAIDGNLGHVCDYIFDDETWAIRYFVVDTSHWWPGGPQVLIGAHWIQSVDWSKRAVHVLITRAQVRSSPAYDPKSPVHRDYEMRLHGAYDRTGHWD